MEINQCAFTGGGFHWEMSLWGVGVVWSFVRGWFETVLGHRAHPLYISRTKIEQADMRNEVGCIYVHSISLTASSPDPNLLFQRIGRKLCRT